MQVIEKAKPRGSAKWGKGENYGVPRFCPPLSKRWNNQKLIEFIKSKPHWNAFDFKYELRISIEHSRYLLLKINLPKLKNYLKS